MEISQLSTYCDFFFFLIPFCLSLGLRKKQFKVLLSTYLL